MVTKTNLPEQIVDEIRARILQGELNREPVIRQDTLAAELGVSKIPVREALIRLQTEGLLLLHPNRGFEVRRLSPSERQEVFEIRLKLEPQVTVEGALRASQAQRKRAKGLLLELNKAMDRNDSLVPGLNLAFHRALVFPSRKLTTLQILERLLTSIRVQVGALPRFEAAKREHAALFAAWCERDEAEIHRLVEEHIVSSLQQLAMDSPH